MEQEELKAIIENILLAADQPVSVDHLQKTLMNSEDKVSISAAIEDLQREYQARSLQIIEVAEGYQLCTRHEYSEWIRKFLKLDKTAKLSQPSLDTLSIIAYKQPLTRQEVDDIRGVDSSGVIKTLLEKKVLAPGGRKKVPGRPIMYRTTRKFLEYFGLKDLSDLPTLDDLNEGESGAEQTTLSFDEPESGEQEFLDEGEFAEADAFEETPEPDSSEEVPASEEIHALEEIPEVEPSEEASGTDGSDPS